MFHSLVLRYSVRRAWTTVSWSHFWQACLSPGFVRYSNLFIIMMLLWCFALTVMSLWMFVVRLFVQSIVSLVFSCFLGRLHWSFVALRQELIFMSWSKVLRSSVKRGGGGILRHTDSLQRQCPTTSSPPSRAMQLQQGFRSSSSSKKGLLDSRAIEEVADTSSLNYYSLFLVTKPDGSFCPIIDLKKSNLFLEIPSFKMETLFSIIAALQP